MIFYKLKQLTKYCHIDQHKWNKSKDDAPDAVFSFLESHFEHINELIDINDGKISSETSSSVRLKLWIRIAVIRIWSSGVLDEHGYAQHNQYLNDKDGAIYSKVSSIFEHIGWQKCSSWNSTKQENVQNPNPGCPRPHGGYVRHVGVHANQEDNKSTKNTENPIDKKIVCWPVHVVNI